MQLQIFAWFDKVDKQYMPDSILLNQSHRPVCRGFLTQFERDRKMRLDEYSLVKLGIFDTDTGVISPFSAPEEIDPFCVCQPQQKTNGDVAAE